VGNLRRSSWCVQASLDRREGISALHSMAHTHTHARARTETTVTSAPRSNSNRTTDSFPLYAALCNAVLLYASAASIDARRSRSNRTTDSLPLSAASCNGVIFSRLGLCQLTSAPCSRASAACSNSPCLTESYNSSVSRATSCWDAMMRVGSTRRAARVSAGTPTRLKVDFTPALAMVVRADTATRYGSGGLLHAPA